MSSQADDESVNPMASGEENDLFVFAPSVATILILICMLYGLGAITIRLVNTFVVSLSPTMSTVGTVLLTLVYTGVAIGAVYRDNQIELPIMSF